MLCDRCQERPAEVHFTQIVNNVKKQMNLCSTCASALQAESLGVASQLNLHDFLAGLLNQHFTGSSVKSNAMPQVHCEKCGFSEAQVAKSGLFGCSNCYSRFGERVRPLLKRIHGGSTHTGKVPQRTGGTALITKEIRLLKNQLQEVIKKEEFEKAADIRDHIKELEQKLQ